MPLPFDPDIRFISNRGKGPMKARIVGSTDTDFIMERWVKGAHGKKTKFQIVAWFLHSPKCGWVRASQQETTK